ncbi:Calcitonin receptor, partial [Araneus ventricosus]
QAYCEAVWDSVLCWPSIPAGQTAWRSCQQVLQYADIPDVKNVVLPIEAKAYRVCNENGVWLWGNWTNYDACVNFTTPGIPKAPLTVSLILLVCSLISLFFLAVTIFIFFYFKSLQCSRLRVHRNLVVALIVHSLMLVVISLPIVGGPDIPSYRDLSWLCKTVVSIKMYAALSSINWMFVEGMLLHSRITTNIFQKDAPFKLYYIIGWDLEASTSKQLAAQRVKAELGLFGGGNLHEPWPHNEYNSANFVSSKFRNMPADMRLILHTKRRSFLEFCLETGIITS